MPCAPAPLALRSWEADPPPLSKHERICEWELSLVGIDGEDRRRWIPFRRKKRQPCLSDLSAAPFSHNGFMPLILSSERPAFQSLPPKTA